MMHRRSRSGKKASRISTEVFGSSEGVTGLWLFALFLVLKPFYLWSSGLPQLADFALIVFVAHELLGRNFQSKRSPSRNRFRVITPVFLYWTIIVNLFAAFFVGAIAPFLSAIFMNVYNMTVSIVVFSMFLKAPRSVAKALYIGSLASISIQALLLLVEFTNSGLRATGTFNNPNQLALHGILILGLLVICHEVFGPKSFWWTYWGMFMAFVCIALSLSRSGAIAAIILLVGIFLSPPVQAAQRWLFRVAVFASVIGLMIQLWYTQNPATISWLDSFTSRASRKSTAGFEAERGYDRIFDFPEYWLFGAGEGAHWRFDSSIEFHSTLGTIQVSYGVVGLVLFLGIVFISLRNLASKPNFILYASVVLSILVYGLAHNLIRSTLSWIIFAVLTAWGQILTNRNADVEQTSLRSTE